MFGGGLAGQFCSFFAANTIVGNFKIQMIILF